jgi:adenylate kinase
LRSLPIEKQQEIGIAASHKIAQRKHPLTIVDTHACIKTPVGYCPGIPLKILNALNPKGLILVESSPSIILERRQKDNSRKRDKERLSDLTLHQELTRSFLASASVLTGAVLCVVNNDSEKISENIEPLVKLIESIQLK